MSMSQYVFENAGKVMPSATKIITAIGKAEKDGLRIIGKWLSRNKENYTDAQMVAMRSAYRRRLDRKTVKGVASTPDKVKHGFVDDARQTTAGDNKTHLPKQLPLLHEPSVKSSEFKTTESNPEKGFRYTQELKARGLRFDPKTNTLTHPKMHAAIKKLKAMSLTEVRSNPHFIAAHKNDPKLTPNVFKGDRIQELRNRIDRVKKNFFAAARASRENKETKHLGSLDEKAGKPV